MRVYMHTYFNMKQGWITRCSFKVSTRRACIGELIDLTFILAFVQGIPFPCQRNTSIWSLLANIVVRVLGNFK